jgi:hypothetical protein
MIAMLADCVRLSSDRRQAAMSAGRGFGELAATTSN